MDINVDSCGLKVCKREILFVYFLVLCFVLIFLEQFQVCNSYKPGKYLNKVSYCFGKIEENMDVSHIHLAVYGQHCL